MSIQTIDFQRRRRLLDEIMEVVHEDLPLLPIIQSFNLHAVRLGLGWTPRLARRVRAFGVHPENPLPRVQAGHRDGLD